MQTSLYSLFIIIKFSYNSRFFGVNYEILKVNKFTPFAAHPNYIYLGIYIPDLQKNLVHSEFITPNYFDHTLNSHLGNSFGVEPRLTHSAFFRPHNKSEDIEGLYLVGASSQPGAGTPSVMMSAKMTARIIANDFSDDLKKWRGE